MVVEALRGRAAGLEELVQGGEKEEGAEEGSSGGKGEL